MSIENQEQILASDPTHSVWVSASAGTGKTKVLTDRMLRLLIEGVPLEKILCLTFTNAAATEMTNRVNHACLEWQTNTDSLKMILGRTPTKEEVLKAKQLFLQLMLSPRPLPTHTIHSFCQKILQSFPFEAGIQPGFKVISEIEAKAIIEQVVKDLGKEIEDFSLPQVFLNDLLPQKITYLLQNLHENTFLEIIREILTDRIYFQELFKQFPDPQEYEKFLRQKMGVEESEEALLGSLWKVIDHNTLLFILGGESNKKNLSMDKDIFSFFLTAKGEPKKKLLTKKESESMKGLEEKLYALQGKVYEIDQRIKISRMIFGTIAIYVVSQYIINKYNFYKDQKGYLDYDDLIYYTKELLTRSDMRDWVLYKLDGGLNHLLVDEAQDTSPEQWQIIEAIISEFYSGSTRFEDNRTIFIVGDEKQSIYSFQGANVENFNRFNDYIRKQMQNASKSYRDAHLIWSYRSSGIILEFIECLAAKYSIRSNDNILKPFRQSKGTVEIWSLYYDKNVKEELFWPLVQDMSSEEEAHIVLARDIAKYISNYIKSGIILESTGKPARAEDFMILVRRRNSFMEEVINSLKDQKVEVGGVDRMILTDHISVKDILSLAKYALMPQDELNMAELIKSPIIGQDDGSLLKILNLLREDKTTARVALNKVPILSIIRNAALSLTVSEFFYNLIEVLNLRQVLAYTNGASTNDALDELLNLVITFEKNYSSNLQEFIYWIERKKLEIKRDPTASNAVKVMTIHGAKGLEAPIVILADTTTLPTSQNNLLWENGIYLWLGGAHNTNDSYSEIKKSSQLLDYQEYLRLLYVALTRAEDHLIIVGAATRENIPEGCFYDVADKIISEMQPYASEGYKWIGEKVEVSITSSQDVKEEHLFEKRKATLADNINSDYLAILHNKCSIVENHKIDKGQSPLDSRTSLNYGQLIHKILEDSVNTRNFEFSPSHPMIKPLAHEIQITIIDKITKLFLIEEFKTLINSTNIKTEVPIGYNDKEVVKIGRIDLLSISALDKKIIILDYKTDKKVPKSSLEVPEAYITQLQFYYNALKKIYPDYQVLAKILWIDNLTIMGIC